jgi:membrane protease YdiL (CAAX protease family)
MTGDGDRGRSTTFVTGLLSVAVTGALVISTAVLFVVSMLVLGQERAGSFANTFFIQCIVFVVVLGGCLLLHRIMAGPMGLPRHRGHELLGLGPTSTPVVALGLVAGAALTFPLGELDNLWQYVWPPSEQEILTMLQIYEPESAFERVFILLALVAAAPLGEEMVFRGVLYRWLADSSRPVAALVVTSVLFGAAHVFIPRTIVLIVPVGLMLGWLVMRTGSILPTIAAHAAFNGAPLVATWSGLTVNGWNNIGAEDPHLHPALVVGGTAVLLACLAGVWLLTRRRPPGALPPARTIEGHVDEDPAGGGPHPP